MAQQQTGLRSLTTIHSMLRLRKLGSVSRQTRMLLLVLAALRPWVQQVGASYLVRAP
jgi:hypothetical protein